MKVRNVFPVVRKWSIRVLLLQVLWTTVKGIDIPAPPTNVKVSNITCTSALVSWDEAANGSDYNVEWRLQNDTAANIRSQDVRGQHHMTMSNLQPSNDNVMNNYIVSVSSIREGVKGSSSDIVFSTRSNAVAVQPYAIPGVSGVIVEWSIPAVNTGCDGHTINEYIIRYNPVGSTDVSEIPVQLSEQNNIIENINDTLSLTQYEYTVVVIDPNGTNVSSDIKYFTTQTYRPPPPSLLSAELHSNSIIVTWEPPSDASLYKITHYVIQVTPLAESYTANPVLHSFANNGTSFDSLHSGTIANLMPDTLYKVRAASKSTVGLGSFSTDHLLASTTSFVPVAPVSLSYEVVSNHTLVVSWSYPPSLIKQITSFEVTYNLVSAYNTSAGMKSFAEYDVFNTTETSFHFALVSSVTNYIFTVTPYSATRAGDSARLLIDDFSAIDLVEDPVIFFNLRLSDTTYSLSLSSDNNEINSDLTRLMHSSINDMCQCTLPSYTLRGSMDPCDSQSNCAIYTGRLLGSDTASASEVFEMVEDWLTIQNGSLLNGTLSIDPDCPLRRLSPSDTVCSFPNITSDDTMGDDRSIEENEPSGDRRGTDGLKMLAVGFASGFGIIICTVLICASVFKSRKIMKQRKPDALTHSESEARLTPFLQTADVQRHYSVIVERNPSYHRHRNNVIMPFITSNDRQLEASSSDSLSSENPYSYTSLKSAQRQANALGFRQQEDTHLPVEQPVSESYTNEYVVESLTSSGYYFNEEHTTTEFHPSSTPNGHGAYLSVS